MGAEGSSIMILMALECRTSRGISDVWRLGVDFERIFSI